MNGETVILGLSGGVDSAAAALLLLRQGWRVEGVWLDLGFGDPAPAREAARQLGIGFTRFDAAAAHEALVRAPFAEAYLRGVTPNPCAVCNPSVKLPSLLAAAERLGASRIATGHYAALREEHGRMALCASGSKDQSYMLAMVPQDILRRLLLPLSGLEKPQIRALAAEAGLTASTAKDSQDICFVPDGDYGAYLERRGVSLPEGNFVDESGAVLGRHRGLHRYTVGQRRGLGVAAEQRLYVKALRPEQSEVVLCREAELLTQEIFVSGLNWGAVARMDTPFRVSVRTRSGLRSHPALAEPTDFGLRLRFDAPLRRPAPGQLAVGYDGARVLFGGTILNTGDIR